MPMTTLYYAILFMSVRTNQKMMDTNGLKKCGLGIHRPNQFERILFLMKIDVQQESEN
jgi:hypothetical protein